MHSSTHISCIYKYNFGKFRDMTLTGKDRKSEVIYSKINKIFEVAPTGKSHS